MKNAFLLATTFYGSATFPFVIPTERTRISYFAALATTTPAALRGESRRNFINATKFDRKSGGA
jgi:hypothetical protein